MLVNGKVVLEKVRPRISSSRSLAPATTQGLMQAAQKRASLLTEARA